MNRILRKTWHWCWGIVAFALIAAAVLLTVVRLALPFLGEYRAEAEHRVEQYLGVPVRIGHMDVEWHGLGPRLKLTDVAIQGPPPAGHPVHFDEAYVDLGLVHRDGWVRLAIRGVSLVGVRLNITVDDTGRLSLLGFTVDPAAIRGAASGDAGRDGSVPAGAGAVVRWLLSTEHLQLLHSTLAINGPGDRDVELPDIDLRLRNDGARHHASASLNLPSDYGGTLRAVLDFTGTGDDYGAWRGRFYLAGTDLRVGSWSALWSDAPLSASGGLDVALWTDWSNGRMQRAIADVRARDVTLSRPGTDRGVTFGVLGGRLAWRGLDDGGWRFDAGRLQVERNGHSWPASGGFSIAHDPAGWRIGADFLRAQDVAALAAVFPLPPAVDVSLAKLAPRGDVQRLRAAGTGPDRFALRADLRGAAWAPLDRAPGVEGLDARARLDASGGTIELAGSDVTVHAPRLFREPLSLTRIDGDVRLARDVHGVRVRSDRLVVANEDLQAVGRVAVDAAADAPVWLDLQFNFGEGDLGALSRYLPARIMRDDLVAWLDHSIGDGRVTGGTLLLRGPADAFPYPGHEGQFDIDLQVADADLQFDPAWPAINDIDARLHFHGPSLAIDVADGRVFDARLASLKARFADLGKGLLELQADASGPLADMVRVVNESPLSHTLGAFFDGARASGDARLDLDLSVPVEHADETRVQGRLQLSGNRLAQSRFDLDLQDLDGAVAFTDDSLSIDGLDATLRGRPAVVDAHTEDAPGRAIVFTARGDFGLADLVPGLPAAVRQATTGRSPWRVDVRVPIAHGAGPLTIRAESDLVGTAVSLPAPLAKPAGQARPLRFVLPLRSGDGADRAELHYGDDLSATLSIAGVGAAATVERGTVRFGAGASTLRDTPGLYLVGHVDRLDLGAWREALAADTNPGGVGAADTPLLAGASLHADRVVYHGHALSDVVARIARDSDRWRLDLDSNEASGKASLPRPLGATARPCTVRLDWIDLALLASPGSAEKPATGGFDGIDPAALPPLDLRIDRVKTRDATLHDVVVVTGPMRNGMTIHRVQFENPHFGLEGQGQWLAGDPQRTQVRMTIHSDDLGSGFESLGYGDTFGGGSGKVTAELQWSGPPWNPMVASLSGSADVDLKDGIITEVDPGPARLLGLFSLNVLQMDFSTLLRKGFQFERINGRIAFSGGNAYTHDLVIKGPAGRIRVRGRTGLVAEDYDQTIQFRPELSQSLPIIGALSGGPATGLAVALVQGLLRTLGADVNKATELTYRLTGSWADPKVDRVNESPPGSSSSGGPAPDAGDRR